MKRSINLFRRRSSLSRHPGVVKTRNKSMFNNHVSHMLKWLIRTYGINPAIFQPSVHFCGLITHIGVHKGRSTALKVIKECRLQVTRYLSGEPLKVGPVTHGGVPRKLRGLIPFIVHREELKFIMTVLFSMRRITLPPQLNVETIVSASMAGDYSGLKKYISPFSKALLKRVSRGDKRNNKLIFPVWEGYHLSTKSGPTSQQALYSCMDDLLNLPESLIKSIEEIGGPDLGGRMLRCRQNENLLRSFMDQPKSGKTDFRKICTIEDSEGKSRVVAIGDYWSQTCLKPIHDLFYRVLRTIPQDQTFNQGEGLRDLPLDGSHTYFSFDLSAATDRFPVRFIGWFFGYHFGENIEKAWLDIMVGYPFTTSKGPKGVNREYYYSVGNPMGFYTSWASFAIMHHFVLFIASSRVGISWTTAQYKLLGDDIVIFDDSLATEYRNLISLLGVEISDQKTHRSKYFFEFAKRYFVPEGEISPFSIKALFESRHSFMAMLQLLEDSKEKGWIPVQSSKDAVLDFYRSKPNSYRRKTRLNQAIKIEMTTALFKRLKGYTDDLELINTALVTSGMPFLSCNQKHVAKAIFTNCIVRAFESSASQFLGDKQDRLYNLILFCTQVNEETKEVDPEMSLLPYAHPYSYVVGKFVEQTYSETMRKAYDFDTLYGGEWLPYLRVLKAADATSLLRRRSYAVAVSSSPLLLKFLKESLDELRCSPYY